jgi:hypothetical protein
MPEKQMVRLLKRLPGNGFLPLRAPQLFGWHKAYVFRYEAPEWI